MRVIPEMDRCHWFISSLIHRIVYRGRNCGDHCIEVSELVGEWIYDGPIFHAVQHDMELRRMRHCGLKNSGQSEWSRDGRFKYWHGYPKKTTNPIS